MDYTKLGEDIAKISQDIRFVEIYHNEKKYRHFRDNTIPLLDEDETNQSINDALQRWKGRMALSDKLGKPIFAMAEYEKVKRITIPFNQKGLILVSIDHEGFHEVLIREIIEVANLYLK